jgi:hypothetical protein
MSAINLPRPPWPADKACTTEGCGHRMDQHAKPIREDGHCTIDGCDCFGFDPLTKDQWATAFAEYHRDKRAGVR